MSGQGYACHEVAVCGSSDLGGIKVIDMEGGMICDLSPGDLRDPRGYRTVAGCGKLHRQLTMLLELQSVDLDSFSDV